jgi:hypothetical protein
MNRARLVIVVLLALLAVASAANHQSKATPPQKANDHAQDIRPVPLPTATSASVLTQHNDNQRTGANLLESKLSTANVNVNQFGKLFTRTVSGYIYAQPLVAADTNVPGAGLRNLLFVATESNNVYAFDADDSDMTAPYWQVNLGTPMPSQDIFAAYRDLTPEIGITATPVIDRTSNTIYVVAKTKETATDTYHHKLHALDLSTGNEKFNGPVEITASVAGVGSGSVSGTVTFDQLHQLNRPGLLLLGGVVYIAFGSHGDAEPYHGWVLGYNATTLQQVAVFNTTPDGAEAAIWQGGQGLAADASNNIYLVTGNGTFDLNQGGRNYGNAVIRLDAANNLAVADWFVPYNQDLLNPTKKAAPHASKPVAPRNLSDVDLGAGGPLLLPGTNLMLMIGKDTVLRLFDRSSLGHYFSDHNADVQEFKITNYIFMGAPIYWDSPNGSQIYLWGAGDYLKVFRLTGGLFSTAPVSQSAFQSVFGYSNSAPLSLSANGSLPGTGVVWALCAYSGDANQQTVTGILRAFDATDVSKELWNSKLNEARDDIGNFAKFNPPTIANGKVYVPTFSGQLHVYGLLPAISPTSAATEVSGGKGVINVTAPTGIHWTAATATDWINVLSTGGIGDGTVSYAVEENLTGRPRKGTITVAGRALTITQAGFADANCVEQIAPTTTSVAAQGGRDNITISAFDRCSWQATSSAAWITITSDCCGYGNGQITYDVAANPDTSGRVGTISVGGKTLVVKQKGH